MFQQSGCACSDDPQACQCLPYQEEPFTNHANTRNNMSDDACVGMTLRVRAGRLADMATQMGVSQATGPLGELSKGVSNMANMLGAQVRRACLLLSALLAGTARGRVRQL
jgi:hypothetical protein